MLAISGGAGTALAVAVIAGLFTIGSGLEDHSVGAPANAIAAMSGESPSLPSSEPARDSAVPAQDADIRSAVITLEAGDTLLAILTQEEIPYAEASAVSSGLKPVVDPRTLRAGQRMRLRLRREGVADDTPHLQRLSFVPETDRRIVVTHEADERFRAEAQAVKHSSRLVSAEGEITTSLYEVGHDQGIPMAILLQAYRTLGHAVDFQRDIHAGDDFELGYEIFDDGTSGGIHPGKLQYASLRLEDRTVRTFRYTTGDGYTGFFDADGRSVETSLMKTPVDGGELSSLFGKRDHPMLGYTRMHKGLDFAAPRGAPVLAAGDGIVDRRSRYGSFGKYIRVRHDKTYTTAYAHLSRYAKGLRPGDRVRQGEVIGYVGATGLATGPNLHYEVLADGDQVNPMTLDLPPLRVLGGEELARFQEVTEKFLVTLGSEAAVRLKPDG